MNHKWSFFGVRRFYKTEEVLDLLTNVSDSEESTSESENEGDSSDSSAEDALEQHQVRTNSNILMPIETTVSKAKEIPKKCQKVAPKLVDNQSATKHALLADQTATTSGEEHVASPQKVSKVAKAKEIPKKAKKPHQNWLIRLIKQPPHQVRNMLFHLQKYPKMAKMLYQNRFIIRVPIVVIWMQTTIMLLKMPTRVLLPNMCLA